MAITITSTPQILTPAYNPVEFTFTSTNATKSGFKYLVDIYSGNTTASLVARQRIPALLDGSGRVDISRILNNFVEVDAPLSAITTPHNTTLSKFDYSIRVGEEYNSDTLQFLRIGSLSAGTYTTLSGTSVHPYVTGDTVFVTSAFESFNGYYNVTHIINVRQFAVDKQANFFTGSSINSSGTTILVPAVKLQFSGLSVSSDYTVFNGVKTFGDFIDWSGANYTLSAASLTKTALTDQPANNFYATPSQDIIMNFYVSGASSNTYQIKASSNNGIDINSLSFTGNGTKQLIQFAVGIGNLGYDANNLNIQYYDFALYRNNSTKLTNTYRIYIDRRCTIEPIEILFMDRMGSLSSFAFQLRSQETGTVNRTAFKQQVQRPYNTYNSYDRGDTNININFDKEYSLQTNFMTEEMSIYFEQLITSPYTWIKLNNKYYACMIIDNSFEVVHQKNRRLISKSIKIKLSNSNNINI